MEVDPAAENNPHAYAIAMVGEQRDVLEVGCAAGHVTEHLVARGNRVTGVEVDPDAAEHSRPLLRTLHLVDLNRTPLSSVESNLFDVILLGDVIEHFDDPVAVIVDLMTLLRTSGRVVVSVPHVAHVDVRLMLLEGAWDYQDDGLLDRTHLRWFTRAGLREVLAEAGLVATAVQRVRVGIGATNVPCHPELHGDEVLDFIRADPEWNTLQLVVTAERDTGQHDVLAEPAPVWPPPGSVAERIARLEASNAALRAQLDAWERSKAAKLSRTAHRVTDPLRRHRGAVSGE